MVSHQDLGLQHWGLLASISALLQTGDVDLFSWSVSEHFIGINAYWTTETSVQVGETKR